MARRQGPSPSGSRDSIDANRGSGREVIVTPSVYRRCRRTGYARDSAVRSTRAVEPHDVQRVVSSRSDRARRTSSAFSDPIGNFRSTPSALRSAWSMAAPEASTPLPELRHITPSSLGRVGEHPLLVESQRSSRIAFATRIEPSTSTSGWNPGCRPTPFAVSGFGHVIVEPATRPDAGAGPQLRGSGPGRRHRLRLWPLRPYPPIPRSRLPDPRPDHQPQLP